MINEVQLLLDAIVDRDERDRAALSAQRDRVGGEINIARRGTVVHRAYGTAGEARYTDQSG